MKKLILYFCLSLASICAPAAITLNPTTLPNGLTGHVYSQTMVATAGSGNYIYTIMSGSFPTGYTLGLQNGAFGGTCIVAGAYTFRIRATGRSGDTTSRSYTVTIADVVLSSTSQFVNLWNSRYVPEYSGLWDTWNNHDPMSMMSDTAFMDGGNSFGAVATLGTNDNFALAVETNGSERMRILNTGLIGVGTATPAVKLDVSGGSVRSLGTAGAATGSGTELYSGGLKAFDYSGAAYTALDLDGLGLTFSNQGVIGANLTGGNMLIGGAGAATGRLQLIGANNLSGNFALDVGGSTNTNIFTVDNSGLVGINTFNSFALSVAPRAGATGQFISYSPAFRTSIQVSDNDGGALGDGTVTLMGSVRVDAFTGNMAIGGAVTAGDRFFMKSGTASFNYQRMESANGNGAILSGFVSNEPYIYMYSQAIGPGTNTVQINGAGDNYFNGGNVGFMKSNPDAYIHAGAGTATAGTAPMKFDAGTLNTVQEAGAVECANDNIYYTENSTLLRTQLGKTLTASDTMDVPAVIGTGAVYTKTITVTGAVDGDVVSIGSTNAMQTAGGFFTAWVSAGNTVSVQFMNVVGGSLNPAAGTMKVTVLKN